LVRLDYAHYDPVADADEPPTEQILATMCRRAGLTGRVALRPYLFLTPEELAAGRRGTRQIAIQSSGRAAAHFMQNKEWFPERFQQVCDALCPAHTVVQIGSAKDPALAGALDLRGQTSLRESAAILANSTVFIGLVGFLMHLARAVDCRSVIVFGGREKPWQTGYLANRNLTGDTACSPCWLRNRCDYSHECMHMITAEGVLAAAGEQVQRHGQPLEVETAEL
jgi:ADP-heptose:LPS heptosyltransferase